MKPFAAAEDGALATVLYFRLRGLLLTPEELLRLLPAPLDAPHRASLERLLEGPLSTRIRRIEGLVVVAGDSGSVQRRHRNYVASLVKWRILTMTIPWIRWLPFLRMVAVTNTLSLSMADEDSDIDLLIVGKNGRLWTVRFLVTAIVQLLGRRRHANHITNRLCLSFYLTERALDLRRFFEGGSDLHYAYWVAMTAVVFEAEGSGTAGRFSRENSWITEYFPQHYWMDVIQLYRSPDSCWSRRVRQALERALRGEIGDWLERLLRRFQKRKIYSHPDSRVHQKGSVDVVVNDDVLKFHESDSRREHREAWEQECRRYGIAYPSL